MSLNMLILGLLFFFQPQPQPLRSVHLPTSTAVDVARKVARDLGYPIDRYPKLFSFDMVTDKGGKPLFAGYTTIGFYGDPQPINHFEINESTGQIVDADECALFDFPDLRAFQRERQQLSGSRPSTTKELANQIGCDTLTVVRRPVVPSTKSALPKK